LSCTPRPSCNETCRLTKHPRVTYRIQYHINCDIVYQPTISYINLRHRITYLRYSIQTYDIVYQPRILHYQRYRMFL
jgi:hypothetical protein